MAMKTYSFKLKKSKRLKKLHELIDTASEVYNHCIALHNRFYSFFGKYAGLNKIQLHLVKMFDAAEKSLKRLEAEGYEDRPIFIRATSPVDNVPASAVDTVDSKPAKKKRKQAKKSVRTVEKTAKKKKKKNVRRRSRLERLRRVVHWRAIGSQSIQNITQRINNGYQAFFDNIKERKAGLTKRRVSKPTFKSRRKYKSFTLKVNTKHKKDKDNVVVEVKREPSGWKFPVGDRISIANVNFRFYKSREVVGVQKTLTVKRDRLGDIYIHIVCDVEEAVAATRTGSSVGLDFGLKKFLVGSDGSVHLSPLFFKQNLKEVRRANRDLSKKKKGSHNRERAHLHLARVHKHVANCRKDHHFKLAREICLEYADIAIEDLNMKAMQQMWGRKVSDLGFAEFVSILKWTAFKLGSTVTEIPRFYPSSKTCSNCGHVLEKLELSQREWACPQCGAHHDRDFNAAKNIHSVAWKMRTKATHRPSKKGARRVGASTRTREGVRPVAADGLPSPVS